MGVEKLSKFICKISLKLSIVIFVLNDILAQSSEKNYRNLIQVWFKQKLAIFHLYIKVRKQNYIYYIYQNYSKYSFLMQLQVFARI